MPVARETGCGWEECEVEVEVGVGVGVGVGDIVLVLVVGRCSVCLRLSCIGVLLLVEIRGCHFDVVVGVSVDKVRDQQRGAWCVVFAAQVMRSCICQSIQARSAGTGAR